MIVGREDIVGGSVGRWRREKLFDDGSKTSARLIA